MSCSEIHPLEDFILVSGDRAFLLRVVVGCVRHFAFRKEAISFVPDAPYDLTHGVVLIGLYFGSKVDSAELLDLSCVFTKLFGQQLVIHIRVMLPEEILGIFCIFTMSSRQNDGSATADII